MRLWHQLLIPYLPRQQLLGQHRECCALRGLGWGKKHSVVNYVFNYSNYRLFRYHLLIIHEMNKRKYKVTKEWYNPRYRGKQLGYRNNLEYESITCRQLKIIYPEHNYKYLQECLDNLRNKGIILEIENDI